MMTFRSILALPLLVIMACATAVQPAAEQSSARNTDLARSGYAAFAKGDVPAVMALMDPAIVWYEAESLPYGGVHRGPDAVLQNVFMALGRDWAPFSVTPHDYIASGNDVVVLGEYSGTHRQTGKTFVSPFAHVWRFQNGRVIEFRQLTDTQRWLAAMR